MIVIPAKPKSIKHIFKPHPQYTNNPQQTQQRDFHFCRVHSGQSAIPARRRFWQAWPSYKAFLEKNNHTRLNFGQLFQLLPITEKENYIRTYNIEEHISARFYIRRIAVLLSSRE